VNTQFFSTVFIAIIMVWAIWAALSSRVRDGIFGKLIYSVIALAGYAIIQRSETFFVTPTVAGVTFHGGLALAGVRHFFIVTWWAQVKAWLCKKLSCEHCLHRDDRAVKVERRKS
jgi:hypothetical protein